jgi:DNA-binding XRE family transcriptional regulator
MTSATQHRDTRPLYLWVREAVAAAGGASRVAPVLGLNRRTVNYWLSGHYLPTLDVAVHLAAISGVAVPAHTPLAEVDHAG